MESKNRTIVIAILGFAAVVITSCSGIGKSKAASITDLTLETRVHRGLVMKHSEILSINGLIPIPDVGLMYHHHHNRNPMTTIAISRDHSYRLVGKTKVHPKRADVAEVRDRIDNIQHLTAKAIAISTEIAALRSKQDDLRNKDRDKEKEKDDKVAELVGKWIKEAEDLGDLDDLGKVLDRITGKKDSREESGDDSDSEDVVDSENRQASPAGTAGEEANAPKNKAVASANEKYETEINGLKQQRSRIDERIGEERRKIAEARRKNPGIIIARWDTSTSSSVRGSAGSVVSGSASSTDAEAGFVVLGGLRVSLLVFGDDYKQMVARLEPDDLSVFRYAGVTSYVLQTRHIEYTTDLTSLREFRFDAEVSAAALTNPALAALNIDKVRINTYFKSLSQLANSGSVSGFTWERRPYCFVAGPDLTDLQNSTARNAGSPGGVFENVVSIDTADLGEFDGWSTIVSQIATPPSQWDVFKSLAWEKMVREFRRSYKAGNIPPAKDGKRTRCPCTDEYCDEYPSITGESSPRIKPCLEEELDGGDYSMAG